LVLELIWTRLVRLQFLDGKIFGDDLKQQNLTPLLFADAGIWDGKLGWKYTCIPFSEEQLKQAPAEEDWKPHYVTETQAVIFHQLCTGKIVRIDDPDLLKWLASKREKLDDVLKPLFEKGLILLDGKKIKLTTEMLACMILPTGKFVVAENNSGRLTNWVAEQIRNKKNK
jgi:hypothetical protein